MQIDGVKWPVKQVLAVAGLKRTSFQSQNSRRLLGNLGFAVGKGAEPGVVGKVSPRTSMSRARFDADALEVIESLDVRVSFDWLGAGSITLDAAGLPKFPSLPRLPGLYRYDFGVDETGIHSLYIGESVELARRANNYRNAKTDRSRRESRSGGKRPAHRYDLADYGLTEAEVRAAFS